MSFTASFPKGYISLLCLVSLRTNPSDFGPASKKKSLTPNVNAESAKNVASFNSNPGANCTLDK